MGTFKFTKEVLEHEGNQGALANIQEKLGRPLEVDEVLEYSSDDCGGKICADGEKCVLGNCVKSNFPEKEDLEP